MASLKSAPRGLTNELLAYIKTKAAKVGEECGSSEQFVLLGGEHDEQCTGLGANFSVNAARFGTAVVARAHEMSFHEQISLEQVELLDIIVSMTRIDRARIHAHQSRCILPCRIHKEGPAPDAGQPTRLPGHFRRARNEQPCLVEENPRPCCLGFCRPGVGLCPGHHSLNTVQQTLSQRGRRSLWCFGESELANNVFEGAQIRFANRAAVPQVLLK